MGKRSDFPRLKGDFYETPAGPVERLIPFLEGSRYVEPCAGAGKLVRHLNAWGLTCVGAFDIDPKAPGVVRQDAMALTAADVDGADFVITNPPWTRSLLHPMIDHLVGFGLPVWLLFDADWAHTVQAARFEPVLYDVVSIGRVKWIEDSPHCGKDNAAWYRFGPHKNTLPTFRMRAVA
ncbi:MAG: class I SAM-dependent methyltransferase [Pseudomonadota bacterium]